MASPERYKYLMAEIRIRHHAIAGSDLRGARLDQAASQLFGAYSRARLQKWIRSGELKVDGAVARPTYRMLGGESLQIDAGPDPEGVVLPQEIPLEVLYRDPDLLVINKPAGLVVHPAAGNRDGTLQNALLHFDPGLAAIPRSGIVHRLDKDTSGVMVIARSLPAHAALVAQLQSRSMSRIYEAIALGQIRRGGAVNQPIGRHPRDRKRMAVVSSGRPAVTHYRVLQTFTGLTHVEVSLETGRTHQIRVHLAHLGYAIVGDPVYGRKPGSVKGIDPTVVDALRKFPRQALHARTLRLLHPDNGRQMVFHAPLPGDMACLLQLLRAKAR